ncbi:uncharacterized protein CEXT_632421 [Caerostris extrusa]|uniref:Ionotropic glutamate receptor C-terminal domain-containing protein n=1 Tax=Caerostris extrusa TaxID=172846 RepID=A0AAV4XIB5_CAEEX|nr:uncharacterized protein CEXT_632421 [Caerostris extrusa]
MERKTIVAITPMKNGMYLNKSESGAVTLHGCEGKFLQIVLEALKIKYEIVISKDMLFGDPLPDGNFTGMVGMVQREEVDLAMTYLAMNEIRSKVINFSMPYYATGISFITAKPENSKHNLALLQVFDTTTWIGIGIVLIVMSILFAKFKGSVENNLFKLTGTIVRQSSNFGKSSLRSRILLTAWILFGLVISLSYSVTLLSHLIQPAKVAPIRTFYELSRAVQSGGHKVYTIKTYIPFLLDSEEDHLKKLGKIIIRNNWIIPVQTSQISSIQARVISGLLFGNRDDLFMPDDELCVLYVAFAYNNNFCCKSKLNAILSKLWDSGLYKKLLQDTSFKLFIKSSNNSYNSNIKSPLSVVDFMGAFTLLGIGLILSFIVLILEINFPCKYIKQICEVNTNY